MMRLLVVGILIAPLASAALSAAQQEAARRGTAALDRIQGFNIVLLVGEMQPSGDSTDLLPSGAKRALNDMKDFLPYKHYRVLDSQWTSCCAPGARLSIAGQLQGVVGILGRNNSVTLVTRPYVFTVAILERGNDIPVRFTLRQEDAASERKVRPTMGEAERRRRIANLQDEIATLSAQIRETQSRIEVGLEPPKNTRELQDRHNRLQRELNDLTRNEPDVYVGSARATIDSNFTMEVGETVVVGTSKLGGDKALIALVTAARRTTGSSRE